MSDELNFLFQKFVESLSETAKFLGELIEEKIDIEERLMK